VRRVAVEGRQTAAVVAEVAGTGRWEGKRQNSEEVGERPRVQNC